MPTRMPTLATTITQDRHHAQQADPGARKIAKNSRITAAGFAAVASRPLLSVHIGCWPSTDRASAPGSPTPATPASAGHGDEMPSDASVNGGASGRSSFASFASFAASPRLAACARKPSSCSRWRRSFRGK